MTLTCHERRRPLALEAALRLALDRARGRVGVLVGAGGVVDLDAVEAVDGDLVEAERARAAAERLRAVGARERHAVDAHADIGGIECAEARVAGVGADLVEGDAGDVFRNSPTLPSATSPKTWDERLLGRFIKRRCSMRALALPSRSERTTKASSFCTPVPAGVPASATSEVSSRSRRAVAWGSTVRGVRAGGDVGEAVGAVVLGGRGERVRAKRTSALARYSPRAEWRTERVMVAAWAVAANSAMVASYAVKRARRIACMGGCGQHRAPVSRGKRRTEDALTVPRVRRPS